MSKYRLLKRYPSLPKSWKVGKIVEQSYSPHCYSSKRSSVAINHYLHYGTFKKELNL